jgi:ABC-type multidrug transport system fused ATPase/permease subunit
VRGSVEVEAVSLRWPDGTPGLEEVTLRADPGETIALVGPSGGGKSTLAALLTRALDPDRGSIRIDGLDLREWKLGALRRSVGLVPQETQLFHETLAANLRMACPGASDARLVEALESAGLSGFLAGLSEGLETVVGEHGLRLSGGERQRLALARALLKEPAIHVLDEATSALDPRTERTVLERFFRETAGRTVLLIAHRLTSLTGVDRIYVLHEGRVVERGTHDELYAPGGHYRSLYDHQLRRPSSVTE